MFSSIGGLMEIYIKYLNTNNKKFDEIVRWINHNLFNYMQNNLTIENEIKHILDFLQSDQSPKRLKKMSYLDAERKAKDWVNKLNKNYKETEDDSELIFKFSNDYKIVKLVSTNSYNREGATMRHCVASYVTKYDSTILSLRDKNNIPHATLELCGDVIIQIRGKANSKVKSKYALMILEFISKFEYIIYSSEIQNLGLCKIVPEIWQNLLEDGNYFEKVIKIKYLGDEYLLLNQKLKKTKKFIEEIENKFT
jgi:hypothetical protein